MASEKPDGSPTVEHHDASSASVSHPHNHGQTKHDPSSSDLDAEELKGRDFTVADIDVPPGYFTSFNFLGSMFAIGASLGAGVGSLGFVAPVLAIVNADIGPDPYLPWVFLAYLLLSSVGLLIAGRVTDIFGRRWFFIGGACLATIGSIVCATAHSIQALIGGMTLLGMAASSQLSYAFSISEVVPMKWRFLAQAYACVWVLPCSAFAPIISYVFVYRTPIGWRAIYIFLSAFNALITAAWFFCYHPPTFHMKHEGQTMWKFIKNFDYAGLFLFLAGMILFLMGISWGGVLYPWNSAHVISTIVIGFALLVAFVLYEIYMPLKEPLVPMHLFRNCLWNVCIVLWALGASLYYSNALLWPQMVAVLYGPQHEDPLWPGWASCVPNSAIVFGEFLVPVGAMFPWKHRQIQVSFVVFAIFTASLAATNQHTEAMAIVLIFLAASFNGFNEIMNSTISGIATKDQREIGTSVGVAGSIRQLVSTICSAIYSAVLANRLVQTVPANVVPAVTDAGLPASSVPGFIAGLTSGNFTGVPGLTPAITAVGAAANQTAWSQAFSTVWLVTLAFSGIGVVIAVFYPNMDHLVTNEVTVQVSKQDIEAAAASKAAKTGAMIEEKA